MTNPLSVKTIADVVGATFDATHSDAAIKGVASLEKAGQGEIAYCRNNADKKLVATCQAAAIIMTAKRAESYQGPAIVMQHANPEMAFAETIDLFHPQPKRYGVSASASIHKSAKLADNIWVGEQASLAEEVAVAEGVEIHAGARIGARCKIGKNSIIHANAVLYPGVEVGENCIIHANANIGVDGFGYVRGQTWRKIQHIGTVKIQDNVEIGAGTCVDRGMLDDTIISEGAKLDNLIQIGHNVSIGSRTIMAACTGVAGSAHIGNDCMIGGGSIINGHINIVSQTVLCGGSAVMRAIEKPGVYGSSMTIMPHKNWLRLLSLLHKLSTLGTGLFKKLGIPV